MGLLDQAMPQQQMQPPMQQTPQGGLLGAMPQGGQASSAPSGSGLQMAQQLAANPTPQAAQALAQQLQQKGPQGVELAKSLMAVADNPAGIKQFAQMIIQQLSGGGGQ